MARNDQDEGEEKDEKLLRQTLAAFTPQPHFDMAAVDTEGTFQDLVNQELRATLPLRIYESPEELVAIASELAESHRKNWSKAPPDGVSPFTRNLLMALLDVPTQQHWEWYAKAVEANKNGVVEDHVPPVEALYREGLKIRGHYHEMGKFASSKTSYPLPPDMAGILNKAVFEAYGKQVKITAVPFAEDQTAKKDDKKADPKSPSPAKESGSSKFSSRLAQGGRAKKPSPKPGAAAEPMNQESYRKGMASFFNGGEDRLLNEREVKRLAKQSDLLEFVVDIVMGEGQPGKREINNLTPIVPVKLAAVLDKQGAASKKQGEFGKYYNAFRDPPGRVK